MARLSGAIAIAAAAAAAVASRRFWYLRNFALRRRWYDVSDVVDVSSEEESSSLDDDELSDDDDDDDGEEEDGYILSRPVNVFEDSRCNGIFGGVEDAGLIVECSMRGTRPPIGDTILEFIAGMHGVGVHIVERERLLLL